MIVTCLAITERPALAARSAVTSFLVVAFCAAAIGALGWLLERDKLSATDAVSITGCIISEHRKQAISLFRLEGSKRQLGMHPLALGKVCVESAWPHCELNRMTPSPVDGEFFVAAMNGEIYSVAFTGPTLSASLLGRHVGPGPDALECSRDGRFLISLGPDALCAWDLKSQRLHWNRVGVCSFAVAPKSQSLVCAQADGELVELNIDAGSKIRSLGRLTWTPWKLAISSNDQRMVCVGDCGEIQMFDLPAAKPLWNVLRFPKCSTPVRIAAFSPSAQLLVTPSEKDVRSMTVWNVEAGKPLGDLRGHERVVTGASFGNEVRLISWSADGTIRRWDIRLRKQLSVTSLAASCL